MIRAQLALMDETHLQKYENSKKLASKPYVLWQIDFSRVFNEKGGFDVVVGNPPYVQLQKAISDNAKLGDAYAKLGYESFVKTGDLYCLFYEKGYRLLRKGGTLAFITSNKWMRAGYGERLRGFFANNTNPLFLIDFGSQKIFESATVDVNILIFEKKENKGNTKACVVKENCGDNLSVYVEQMSSSSKFITPKSWVILNPLESMTIVYGVINSAIQKIGIQNFQIYKYTITGKLSLLPMNPSGNECLAAFGVAIVFIVMMISVSSVVFQKRDI